jgi:hypothetical protein
MSAWDKTDVIHFLADQRRYKTYLEICSPTTGGRYTQIDRSRFKTCHRLMYRAPANYARDALDINFRTADARTTDLVETIHAFGFRYDLVLVDSFHTYDLSYRDLSDAFGVLAPGGAIVVHDCLPTDDGDLISLHFNPGSWCGVSFIAYIDFVTSGRALGYLTVDTDYGCGIIRAAGSQPAFSGDLMDAWKAVRHDAKAAYRFLIQNKGPLLNLVSVDEFTERLSAERPGF